MRPRNDSEEVEVQGERLNNKADNEGFVEVRKPHVWVSKKKKKKKLLRTEGQCAEKENGIQT